MATKKNILVIGAGVSGLASIKACKEEDFDVICYEKAGYFGGLWRYHDDDRSDIPSVMKSTVCNGSKEMMSFSDFPPPASFPTYMHHSFMYKYLELYAEHFDLLSCIKYCHEVIQVIPVEDYTTSGRWLVTVRDTSAAQTTEVMFDGVMVCVGHHVFPMSPTYPGLDSYRGEVLHSHSYKTFNGMEGKSVLVVGLGNSGADIAAEVSTIAKTVFLSTRRGIWLFPRTLDKGKPTDIMLLRRYKSLFPSSFLQWKFEKILNSAIQYDKLGIKPNHSFFCENPAVNDQVHLRILSGLIRIKGDVKEFTDDGVIFEEESEASHVDVVVFATGYEIKMPFLSEDIFPVTENKVLLYKNIFPPQLRHPTLAVIGFIQATGSLIALSEIQARWFCSLMTGRVSFPSTDEMLVDVEKTEDFHARHYVQSPRHTVEVSWMGYMNDISEKIGANPNLQRLFFQDQKLFWACFKGPCLPYQFRLNGPHPWEGAREAILTYKDRLYSHMRRDKEGKEPDH